MCLSGNPLNFVFLLCAYSSVVAMWKINFFSLSTQFGFKKGLSCNYAIYSVRRTIVRFVQNGSTINLCAIDLSKAFDEVNLHNLFIKLMQKIYKFNYSGY